MRSHPATSPTPFDEIYPNASRHSLKGAQEQADIVLEITERTLVERAPTVATTTTTHSKDGKTATSTT